MIGCGHHFWALMDTQVGSRCITLDSDGIVLLLFFSLLFARIAGASFMLLCPWQAGSLL